MCVGGGGSNATFYQLLDGNVYLFKCILSALHLGECSLPRFSQDRWIEFLSQRGALKWQTTSLVSWLGKLLSVLRYHLPTASHCFSDSFIWNLSALQNEEHPHTHTHTEPPHHVPPPTPRPLQNCTPDESTFNISAGHGSFPCLLVLWMIPPTKTRQRLVFTPTIFLGKQLDRKEIVLLFGLASSSCVCRAPSMCSLLILASLSPCDHVTLHQQDGPGLIQCLSGMFRVSIVMLQRKERKERDERTSDSHLLKLWALKEQFSICAKTEEAASYHHLLKIIA